MLLGLTLLVASSGLYLMARYELGAGRPARAPLLLAGLRRPSLLVFLHPRCPCSDATIAQLRGILKRVEHPLADVQVNVVLPRGADVGFADADYMQAIASLPSARVVIDREGTHADQMGVETSGQFLAYAEDGHLVFAGGITPGRGVDQENAASKSVEEWLATGRPPTAHTEVYGCPLQGPSDLCGSPPAKHTAHR